MAYIKHKQTVQLYVEFILEEYDDGWLLVYPNPEMNLNEILLEGAEDAVLETFPDKDYKFYSSGQSGFLFNKNNE